MIFGLEISPEAALLVLVAWNLVWDLVIRPRLLRSEIVRYLSDAGGHDLVVGLMRGLAEMVRDPGERQAMDEVLRATLGGVVGATKGALRPPTWKEIIGHAIARRVEARAAAAAEAPNPNEAPRAPRTMIPAVLQRKRPPGPKQPPWGTR